MIDPEEVLKRVQHGHIPANWRVLRGKDSRLPQAITIGVIACLLLFFILLLTDAGLFSQNVPYTAMLLGIACLLVGIAAGIIAWFTVPHGKDSLLVLLPDGLVHWNRHSVPARRSFKVIRYADIARIKLKTITSHLPGSLDTTYSYHTEYALDLTYTDGSGEIWRMDDFYGHPGDTARAIIEAHAQYLRNRID
jgi:hypothetical protein